MQCGLVNSAFLSICFLVGLPWGARSVAAAYAIGNYVMVYPWLRWVLQDSPVSLEYFAAACAMPATLSLIATAVALAIRALLISLPRYIQIGALFLNFSVVFTLGLCFTPFGRRDRAFLIELVGPLRRVFPL